MKKVILLPKNENGFPIAVEDLEGNRVVFDDLDDSKIDQDETAFIFAETFGWDIVNERDL